MIPISFICQTILDRLCIRDILFSGNEQIASSSDRCHARFCTVIWGSTFSGTWIGLEIWRVSSSGVTVCSISNSPCRYTYSYLIKKFDSSRIWSNLALAIFSLICIWIFTDLGDFKVLGIALLMIPHYPGVLIASQSRNNGLFEPW